MRIMLLFCRALEFAAMHKEKRGILHFGGALGTFIRGRVSSAAAPPPEDKCTICVPLSSPTTLPSAVPKVGRLGERGGLAVAPLVIMKNLEGGIEDSLVVALVQSEQYVRACG